jgi:Ca2+-binding EF-hand superfamily protein
MKKSSKSMSQMFNEIDMNGDGYLSKEEMTNIFRTKIVFMFLVSLDCSTG